MALPVKQASWIISPNNRTIYSSLVQVQRENMFGFKQFIKANGVTTKGSSNGVAAAMDGPGTDRWAAATDAGTRGANTTTANSWWCGVLGNGANVLFSYVGATDDIYRISFSPGGLFAAAGTPTHTPTAADEQVICSASTIDISTSLDRIWNGWIDSSASMIRFMNFRNSVMVGRAWGVEVVTPRTLAVPFSPAMWGFCYSAAGFAATNFAAGFATNAQGGLARVNGLNCTTVGGVETFGGNAVLWGNVKTELQGGIGYPLWPLAIGSGTVGSRGPLADLIDWWIGRSPASEGDVYGNSEFITFGSSGAPSMVWPWDGTPSVAGTNPVIV